MSVWAGAVSGSAAVRWRLAGLVRVAVKDLRKDLVYVHEEGEQPCPTGLYRSEARPAYGLATLELVKHRQEASMSVRNLTGFAEACEEAMAAALDAIATVGDERRAHLTAAKSAVDKALHDAHRGDEWYLADQLRRAIKEVEARSLDAA